VKVKIEFKANYKGGKIVLQSPWYPGVQDDCKSIIGWYFSKKTTTWSYPLSISSCKQLRRVFGDRLEIGPNLAEWYRVEMRRLRKLRSLASVHDADLKHVPRCSPTMAAAMAGRTYQRSGAVFGRHAGSFLLADEPGLGKTVVALATVMEMDLWKGDHLITAPKVSLQSVWERQIRLWAPNARVVSMPDGAAKRAAALKEFWALPKSDDAPRFLVVNPEMLSRKYEHKCKKCNIWQEDVKAGKAHWPAEHKVGSHVVNRTIRPMSQTEYPEIIDHKWDTVIVDESHDLLAAYTPANVPFAVAGLLDLKTQHKIALTGTPLRGHEKKIWGHLDWFGMNTGGYWGFVSNYFETLDNGFGLSVGGLRPEMKKDFYELIDRNVLRRTRAEVRKDLPLGQRQYRLLEMSPKHRKQYETFKKDGEVELESGSIATLGTLSELTRLKQMAFGVWDDPHGNGRLVPTADSPKIVDIVEFLRERGITGKATQDWLPEPGSGFKYVFASQWTETLDALERELNRKKIPTMAITGKVTGRARNDVMARFQSADDPVRVLLLSTTAGGMSIELDAWCDEIYIIDETWTADDQRQAEGRIDNRSGRVAPRTFWYAITRDTIEETVFESNLSQNRAQFEMLDGRRGVELALHLLRGDTDGINQFVDSEPVASALDVRSRAEPSEPRRTKKVRRVAVRPVDAATTGARPGSDSNRVVHRRRVRKPNPSI